MENVENVKDLYEAASKSYPKLDIQKVVLELTKTLRESEDYFDKKDSSVEKSIDAHIDEQIPEGNNIATAPTDYRILLSYLDSMPV